MTIDDLLAKWLGAEGGAERANYQMFLTEFCIAMGLPLPDAAGSALGDYRFEGPVRSEAIYGTKGDHRIDLYKRDCFILEAKQRQVKAGEALPDEPAPPAPVPVFDLLGHPIGYEEAPRPKRRYDRLMEDARLQAQRYALALPADHRTPPFLMVADIGRSFELYFDYAGNGRGYAPFPDERSFRIGLVDLRDEALAARLRAVWTQPASIDPRLKAAEVTRDIATRLSRVAAELETTQRELRPGDANVALGVEATSLFLMRMLFCMFAEDVELLPKDSFKRFLADAKDRSELFWRDGLTQLWSRMNDPQEVNRFWSHGDAIVRYFNGNLFLNTQVYGLSPEQKGELLVAAGKDWRQVEPAIFGTLLEQVLSTPDRARLGAHYTPRAYVERVVEATVMDVLRPEWEAVREAVRAALNSSPERGDRDAERHPAGGPASRSGEEQALALLHAFHDRLASVRVLDPACGTGNFLYVALDALMRLEGEVRQLVVSLGGTSAPRVHPNQMLGLELNPRAAVIAELVLWIGWLRYRLQNTPDAIGEPVLPTLTNINGGARNAPGGGFDAVLARTATGEPDSDNPRRPEWPQADFIVGNPPFIGGKDIRERLGGDYAEALWKTNPHVPKSADFVMQWWDRAADILTRPGTRLRRFGFVTTNSITQVFSRRVIARYLASSSPERGGGPRSEAAGCEGPDVATEGLQDPISVAAGSPLHRPAAQDGPPPRSGEELRKLHLVLAIPDHPWTRATKDAAMVRIAMTVAEAGAGEGTLVEIVGEAGLETDEPRLEERRSTGRIHADLSVGTDVTAVVPLKANEGLCSPGVKLHGAGFIVTPAKARELGLGTRPRLEAHIREYRNGRDLLQRPRGVMVIDLFGLDEKAVRQRFPEVYQHLLASVKPERDVNRRDSYKRSWWIFGEPRRELRPALEGLARFIATPVTAKHRVFELLACDILPDDALIAIAVDDPFHLGVLSSQHHLQWTFWNSSLLGVASFEQGHRYLKSKIFDRYPFPNPPPEQRAKIAELAEELDATRKLAIFEVPKLTMTELYNLRAKLRADTATTAERNRAAGGDRRPTARRPRCGRRRRLWLGGGSCGGAADARGHRRAARGAQCGARRRGSGRACALAPRRLSGTALRVQSAVRPACATFGGFVG